MDLIASTFGGIINVRFDKKSEHRLATSKLGPLEYTPHDTFESSPVRIYTTTRSDEHASPTRSQRTGR